MKVRELEAILRTADGDSEIIANAEYDSDNERIILITLDNVELDYDKTDCVYMTFLFEEKHKND